MRERSAGSKQSGRQGQAKPVRVPTIDAGWVEWAVAAHVARFASPRARIEQLLRARVRKATMKGAVVPPNLDEMIAEVLDKHVGHGTIDDAAWAAGRARSLTRRGVPVSVVKQRLRERGIKDTAPAMVAIEVLVQAPVVPVGPRSEALGDGIGDGMGEEAGDGWDDREETPPDVVAGCAYARRKRVGPFSRSASPDRQKELGAMARAGFSFTVAKRVLAMEREAADELLDRLR